MRLKDLLTGSLAAMSDIIPRPPKRVRASLAPQDFGAAFSNDLIEEAIRQDRSDPFYSDEAGWSAAVAWLDMFKARPRVGPGAYPYSLPECFGPFRSMPQSEALDHVCAAFEAEGFRATPKKGMQRAQFELSERLKIGELPAFYGSWLADTRGVSPWKETLALTLLARVEIVMRYGAGNPLPSPTMNLQLSAPGVFLLDVLRDHLAPILTDAPPLLLTPEQLLVNMVARQLQRPAPYLTS